MLRSRHSVRSPAFTQREHTLITTTIRPVRGSLSASILAAAAGLAVATSGAGAQVTTNWVAPGPADFFDAANWDSGVPTLLDDAFISNGGTAEVTPANPGNIALVSLNVGVNGVGALNYTGDFSGRIAVSDALNVGYSPAGGVPSDGSLVMLEGDSRTSVIGDGTALFRVGVTDGAGDANGDVFIDFPGLDFSDPAQRFTTLQLGVSNGAGTAIGGLEAFQLETAFTNLDVGVANGSGDAAASLDGFFRLIGADLATGVANIGVSNGGGNAFGSAIGEIGGFGGFGVDGFSVMNVGVANGAGNAEGELQAQIRLRAGTVNLGTSAGFGGTGIGRLILDQGVSPITTLNMGEGGILDLNIRGTGRGEYAAIDAGTAVIDGTLRARFSFIAQPGVYELVNTPTIADLSGSIDNLIVEGLNQGLAAQATVIDDSGQGKLVLDVTGTTILPAWTNVGAGDWFDAANWSSSLSPTAGDPAFVNNGGEAQASSEGGIGPMETFIALVGLDGGTGSLTSDGVSLNVSSAALFGYRNPLQSDAGAAVGSGTFNQASISMVGQPGFGANADVVGVGLALGGGSVDGTLVMDGGDIRGVREVLVGVANPVDGSVASATGRLEINGAGVGATEVRLDEFEVITVGGAQTDLTDGFIDATGNGTLIASGATVFGGINVADTEMFEPSAIGGSVGDATLTNLEIRDGALDVATSQAFDPGSSASAIGTATVTDCSFILTGTDSFTPDWGEADAFDPGTNSFAQATANLLRTDFLSGPSDIEIAHADSSSDSADAPATAQTTANVTWTDGMIELDEFEVGDADASGMSTAISASIVTLTRVGLTGRELELGLADASADTKAGTAGNASLVASLTVIDSSMTFSEEAFIGEFDGDSTNPLNSNATTLSLEGSTLSAAEIEVGIVNPAGNPLDATLSMNPSLVTTGLLTLGADGTLVFGIEGVDRVDAATVGTATYSAIDAADALLNDGGVITADFDGFTPPDGTTSFDLIVTASPTALDDTAMQAGDFVVTNLPGTFSVESFGVAEIGGVDVVRLTISGGTPCNTADLAEPFGILDLSDVNTFTSGFIAQDLVADLDGNGIFDLTDINIFTSTFVAGCP